MLYQLNYEAKVHLVYSHSFKNVLSTELNTYANSPGLSGSLPDTERISRSPVRVTNSPG